MITRGQAVEREIALGPVEVGAGQIDGHAGASAAGRGMHRDSAGIREKIEEAFAFGQSTNACAGWAVVEEDAGVQVVIEIHAELQAAFFHDVEAELLGDLLILIATGLAFAHANADSLGGNAGDFWQYRECLGAPAPYAFLFDAGGGGVFL